MACTPDVRQLLMGMSIKRNFPASGTAGFARLWVNGKSRAPWPPPRIAAEQIISLI
jgi:hypothetical protein